MTIHIERLICNVSVAGGENTGTTVEQSTSDGAGESTAATGADRQALADRVYRLLRQELAIARERE